MHREQVEGGAADKMPAYRSASVRLGDGKRVAATIIDLSAVGCKITSLQMLPVGELVDLMIAGEASIRASVGWSTLDTAGLTFI
jgi:hypothetical protein